eukprot:365249-Chlamydomonas_euryale.AAC.23
MDGVSDPPSCSSSSGIAPQPIVDTTRPSLFSAEQPASTIDFIPESSCAGDLEALESDAAQLPPQPEFFPTEPGSSLQKLLVAASHLDHVPSSCIAPLHICSAEHEVYPLPVKVFQLHTDIEPVKLLGSGGQGDVMLFQTSALSTAPAQYYAVKVLNERCMDDASLTRRLIKEAAVQQLAHCCGRDTIVPVLGLLAGPEWSSFQVEVYGQSPDGGETAWQNIRAVGYVMPIMPGGCLAEHLVRRYVEIGALHIILASTNHVWDHACVDRASPALVHAGRYADAMLHAALLLCSCGNVRSVVSLLQQSASGVAALHSVGKVHRDLKTENILIDYVVDSDGTTVPIAKVADMGLACASGQTVRNITGTPGYFAPEDIGSCCTRGKIVAQCGYIGCVLLPPVRVRQPPADVYTFGLVMHEALFSATRPAAYACDKDPRDLVSLYGNDAADVRKHGDDALASWLRSHLPREIYTLCESCCDVCPGQRPTMADVASQLAKWLAAN